MSSSRGLDSPDARICSGVGGSWRLPSLAAARVRGRFAGGDLEGGDAAVSLDVAVTAAVSTDAEAGAVFCPSASRSFLRLFRPGLCRRRREGGG